MIKLREYVDKRGSLVENTDEKIMMEVKHFFVSRSKPGVVRGNHYHKRKSEWFYVIQGICQFHLKDKKSDRREKLVVKDSDNIAVNIAPNKVHAFQNIGKNELILLALVNEIHDQKNPDTYEEVILS